MYFWDSIRLILKTVNYDSKVLTTKSDLQELISSMQVLSENLNEDEYELKLGFSQILLAADAIEELPEGVVSRGIQENTCSLLRNVQRTLASLLYNRHLNADVDNVLKNAQQKFVLEKMVEDYLLGNYRT